MKYTTEELHEIVKFMGDVLNPHDGSKSFTKNDFYVEEDDEVYGVWQPINYYATIEGLMTVLDKIETVEGINVAINYFGRLKSYNITISKPMTNPVPDVNDTMGVVSIMGVGSHTSRTQAIYLGVLSFIRWIKENDHVGISF